LRNLDTQLFKRLRGRLPALSTFLFQAKANYVDSINTEELTVINRLFDKQTDGTIEEEEKGEARWKWELREGMVRYAQMVGEE